MDHDIRIDGVSHVATHVNEGERCSGLVMYVHHDLTAQESKKLLHLVELMLPGLLKVASEL